MDHDKFRATCRPLPWRLVLRCLLLPRLLRENNQRIGHLNGWTLIVPFVIGAVVIKKNARDWRSYMLLSGFEVWFWPNRVRYVEGDEIFRYRWMLENSEYDEC